MEKQDTWLPIFTGYYNTIFDVSECIAESEVNLCAEEYAEHYSELYKNGVTYDFFIENFWDYADFNDCFDDASQSICEGLLDLDSNGIIINIKYQKTCSPRYYNFSNDSINCEIEYSSAKLKAFLSENLESFEDYIQGKYTSCDGFRSSYTNELEYWLCEDNWGQHEIGSILNFILHENNTNAESELYYNSNLHEVFYNFKFDYKKCINDFNEQVK